MKACFYLGATVPLGQTVLQIITKLFHCQNQEKICNNTITKDPTTPQVCRKQRVYCLSYCLKYICHILQFLHQMFNVSALLLNDTLKPATPLTNGANHETLRHTLDIVQGVATHWRCDAIFSGGIITNFLLILTVKYFLKSVNIW